MQTGIRRAWGAREVVAVSPGRAVLGLSHAQARLALVKGVRFRDDQVRMVRILPETHKVGHRVVTRVHARQDLNHSLVRIRPQIRAQGRPVRVGRPVSRAVRAGLAPRLLPMLLYVRGVPPVREVRVKPLVLLRAIRRRVSVRRVKVRLNPVRLRGEMTGSQVVRQPMSQNLDLLRIPAGGVNPRFLYPCKPKWLVRQDFFVDPML